MKYIFPPLAVLFLILAFSIGNAVAVTALTETWQSQITQANDFARQELWGDAEECMKKSHRDWTSRQRYLHIVLKHENIDDAQMMYHRAIAFARQKESEEFFAETAELSALLTILAESEQFSVNNLL